MIHDAVKECAWEGGREGGREEGREGRKEKVISDGCYECVKRIRKECRQDGGK
jgi:hypothetical protein